MNGKVLLEKLHRKLSYYAYPFLSIRTFLFEVESTITLLYFISQLIDQKGICLRPNTQIRYLTNNVDPRQVALVVGMNIEQFFVDRFDANVISLFPNDTFKKCTDM